MTDPFKRVSELLIELLVHMLIGNDGQAADRYQSAQEKNEKNPACKLTGENLVIKFHAINTLIIGYQSHIAAVVCANNIVLAYFSRQRGRTLAIFAHTVKIKIRVYRMQ